MGSLIPTRMILMWTVVPFGPLSRLTTSSSDSSLVEGVSTSELSLDEVVKRLKGPKGTTVHIKIMRVGIKEPIPLAIVRAAVPTNSLTNVLMIRPGVGYVRIKDFTSTTVRELDEAVA